MTDAELKTVLDKVDSVVEARLKKAEAETLIRKNGKTDWIHVSVLAGFTITNILALFIHGKLGVALEKIDHLESIVSAASKLAL